MPRRPTPFHGALIALAILGVLGIVAVASGTRDTSINGRVLTRSVAGVNVSSLDGLVRPLAPPEGGTILIVSSTCGHCHELVSKLTQRNDGQPVPQLQVIAIEGAEAGKRMLDSLGFAADVAGPAGTAADFLQRVGIGGTPIIFRVDGEGTVRERDVGVLSDQKADEWLARMRTRPGETG